METHTRMTLVPASQLAGLALAIQRVGGTAAAGKGQTILDETGEAKPTYGDVLGLVADVGTFDLALKNADVALKAAKVGSVRALIQAFGPETPVCGACGDLAVDVLGGELIVRSAGQACPGCNAYLEESEAAKPYVAWTTGLNVAPTLSLDFETVPGDRIPLTDAAIRKDIVVDAALDALLASEGVPTIQFLLWLYHGPEKARFTRAPRKALAVLANPLAETFGPNVTRNWVKAAKGFVFATVGTEDTREGNASSRVRSAGTATTALCELLIVLFTSPNELRTFVLDDPEGESIMSNASVGSHSATTHDVARMWQSRGMIDRGLFQKMLSRRAKMHEDIVHVAARFGIHGLTR